MAVNVAACWDAVLATEIEQLPDLQGYLKFASQAAWMKVTLQAGR